MKKHRLQSGFTAVELLITLFVAAAFLIASYQLFNVVIKDGGNARAQSRAANVAYDYLRRYSTSATIPCSAQTPLTNSSITTDGLTNTKMTVALSCPAFSTTDITKVDVTVTYNTPTQTVKYSTFVNGSGVASSDIMNGLVGWYKFNGNADTSVGSNNGTVSGATPGVGQSGLANTAYAFTTLCQRISANVPALPATITFSGWVYPTAYPSERAAIIVDYNADGYYFSLNSDGSLQSYWYGTSVPGYHSSGAGTVPLNTWSFLTVSWSGSQVKLYVNGVLKTTVATTGGGAGAATVDIGCQGASSSRQFFGRIDDLRIYNRTLSDTEVTTLYTNGAQ